MTIPERPPDDHLPHQHRRTRRFASPARLTRSQDDRILGGVMGGVARHISANPLHVRLLFAASVLLSLGITLGVYLLVWLILPAEPRT
jgi:phage shock protein PspC (stress-responsive transcriptional regulator)